MKLKTYLRYFYQDYFNKRENFVYREIKIPYKNNHIFIQWLNVPTCRVMESGRIEEYTIDTLRILSFNNKKPFYKKSFAPKVEKNNVYSIAFSKSIEFLNKEIRNEYKNNENIDESQEYILQVKKALELWEKEKELNNEKIEQEELLKQQEWKKKQEKEIALKNWEKAIG